MIRFLTRWFSKPQKQTLRYELTELPQIPALAEQVESYLGERDVAQKIISGVNLCLDELLTNTLRYGYVGSEAEPRIVVELLVENGELTVNITDNAVPFDPTAEADAPDLDASLEDRRIGGLGIHFVKTLSDSFRYQRQSEHNILVLTKML